MRKRGTRLSWMAAVGCCLTVCVIASGIIFRALPTIGPKPSRATGGALDARATDFASAGFGGDVGITLSEVQSSTNPQTVKLTATVTNPSDRPIFLVLNRNVFQRIPFPEGLSCWVTNDDVIFLDISQPPARPSLDDSGDSISETIEVVAHSSRKVPLEFQFPLYGIYSRPRNHEGLKAVPNGATVAVKFGFGVERIDDFLKRLDERGWRADRIIDEWQTCIVATTVVAW
jgi:hypothetical protein